MDSADLVEFYSEEINKLRKEPKSIQNLLQDRLSRHVKQENKQKTADCYSHYQFRNILFKTIEGENGIQSALKFVQNAQKLRGLVLNQKLCEAAYQIGITIQKSIQSQPNPQKKEIDISAYQQIIRKQVKLQYPTISQRIEPLIQYGFRRDLDLLPTIVIDDGNYQKSRRNTLFNPIFKSIGISVHQHHQFDYFVLFLFSTYDEPIGCSCEIF